MTNLKRITFTKLGHIIFELLRVKHNEQINCVECKELIETEELYIERKDRPGSLQVTILCLSCVKVVSGSVSKHLLHTWELSELLGEYARKVIPYEELTKYNYGRVESKTGLFDKPTYDASGGALSKPIMEAVTQMQVNTIRSLAEAAPSVAVSSVPPEMHCDWKFPKPTYTKDDLFEVLKRHQGQKGSECDCGCPFTQHSIQMVIRFVCAEMDFPKSLMEKALELEHIFTKDKCLMGRSRLVIAAGIFYIASYVNAKYRMTQAEVAKYFHTTAVSVGVTYKLLLEIKPYNELTANSDGLSIVDPPSYTYSRDRIKNWMTHYGKEPIKTRKEIEEGIKESSDLKVIEDV